MVDLSASQVRKAGKILRKFGLGGHDLVDAEQVFWASDVLLDFRGRHQLPLGKATMGLRSVVNTEKCVTVEVSQRLKRVPTILDKLKREPTLNLASMQDIGGCRAVLGSVDELRRVEAKIKRNRPIVGYNDYVESPRASGYRGVHLIVEYDSRKIEIQLRTQIMHGWAITVERLSGRLGSNLKTDGEQAPQLLLAAISEAMALEEAGRDVDTSLLDRMQLLRETAAPFLPRGGA